MKGMKAMKTKITINLFAFFSGLFAKLAAFPLGPSSSSWFSSVAAESKRTRPPRCPYCGGRGESPIAIAEVCDCGCGTVKIRGGPGRACPICSGSMVVPIALVRALVQSSEPIVPFREHAAAAKWN
jgi:hypothetical protein